MGGDFQPSGRKKFYLTIPKRWQPRKLRKSSPNVLSKPSVIFHLLTFGVRIFAAMLIYLVPVYLSRRVQRCMFKALAERTPAGNRRGTFVCCCCHSDYAAAARGRLCELPANRLREWQNRFTAGLLIETANFIITIYGSSRNASYRRSPPENGPNQWSYRP